MAHKFVAKSLGKGAITCSGQKNALVGKKIIDEGGSVADAAIATMLCDGVTCSEQMGVGGGFILTVYDRANKMAEILIAKETAPLASSKDMFKNYNIESQYGGLSVAIPAELKGYWQLHQKYGKLPWEKLFQPAISYCENGIEAEPLQVHLLAEHKKNILTSHSLRKLFVDIRWKNTDNKITIFRNRLGKTLRLVSQHGPDALYNGVLTEEFIEDIEKEDGIITAGDLARYEPRWSVPVSLELLGKKKVYTASPPSSGCVLLFILNVLSHFDPKEEPKYLWQKIIETWKFGYGYRTKLGDKKFNKHIPEIVREMLSESTTETIIKKIQKMNMTSMDFQEYGGEFDWKQDSGTSHLNFLHPNGDAISVTSSINLLFGAMITSESTGIILNNNMNNFSAPHETNAYGLYASPANFIEPGKIPMSSMCPTILVDAEGDVVMVTGAAGGSRIVSSLSMLISNYIWQTMSTKDCMNQPRIHHQLMPMEIKHDAHFDKKILNHFGKIGHKLVLDTTETAHLSCITRDGNNIYADVDDRTIASQIVF